MSAFSSAWASVMVGPNEFQLFQPIGGVGARPARAAGDFAGDFDVAAKASEGTPAAAAVAREAARRRRRFESM
jgi:hypothetical protein